MPPFLGIDISMHMCYNLVVGIEFPYIYRIIIAKIAYAIAKMLYSKQKR